MINIHNQTEIDKNYLLVGFDPKRAIYGTDGVKFSVDTSTGDVYRALDTVANIGVGSDLTDTSKWAKTDLIENQDLFNDDLGAVRSGVDLVAADDMKLNVSSGHFIAYNRARMGYERFNIAEINGATFDYIDKDGNTIEAGATKIDGAYYYDGTNKVELSKPYHATFQKVYIDLQGNLKVVMGDTKYPNLDKATYRSITEQIPQFDDLHYIGGFILKKSCATLDSNKNRTVYASKLGESQVGTPAGTISKLKEPVADLAALKDIEMPESGEMRQDLSELPKVVMWAFNEEATSGEAPNDGTTGYWNKIEAETSRSIENKTADFTAEPNKDYIIDCSGGDITATVNAGDSSTAGKIISFQKTENSNNTVSVVSGGNTIYVLDIEKHSVEVLLTDGGVRVLSEYNPLEENVLRADVGRIVFQLPNPSLGVYPLDGSTVKDKLLAEHISNNSSNYVGFSVNGDEVTLPDWRGHILYGAGGLGLDDNIGTFVEQSIQSHRHKIPESYSSSGGGYSYESGSSHDADYAYTKYYGGSYTRTKGYTAQLCILGTTYVKLDENSTIATPITVTFNGKTVDNGKTNVTIYEGVYAFVARVDLDNLEEIDTVTNASIIDSEKGLIAFNQSIGGGDFTIDITTKSVLKKWSHQTFTTNVSIDTSEKTVKEWDTFNKKAGDVVELSYRMPTRNDDNGWGGSYLFIYYSVDDGANWTKIFDSGHDNVMAQGGDIISSHTGTFIVDIDEVTNAEAVKFKYNSKTYTGSGTVNGSHGISSHTGSNGYTTLSLKVLP